MLKVYGNIYVGATIFFGWIGNKEDPQNSALFFLPILNTTNLATVVIFINYLGVIGNIKFNPLLGIPLSLALLIGNYYLFGHKMEGKKYMKRILYENKIPVAIRSFILYLLVSIMSFLTMGILYDL